MIDIDRLLELRRLIIMEDTNPLLLAKYRKEYDTLKVKIEGKIEKLDYYEKFKDELNRSWELESQVTLYKKAIDQYGVDFKEQINEIVKLKERLDADVLVKQNLIHLNTITNLLSTLDEIKEYIFADDFVFPCRDMVRDRIKEITNMEDNK